LGECDDNVYFKVNAHKVITDQNTSQTHSLIYLYEKGGTMSVKKKQLIIFIQCFLIFIILCNVCYSKDIHCSNNQWSIFLDYSHSTLKESYFQQPFNFQINPFDNRKSYKYSLINSNIKKLMSIHLYKSKLIIIGELIYGGDIVTIYDLNKRRIENELNAYNFKISPNKRYAIFSKFFPRFSPEEYQCNIIYLYDFLDNTIKKGSIGKKIFPNTYLEKSYKNKRFLINSPIVWSKKSNQLAFIMKSIENSCEYIVVKIIFINSTFIYCECPLNTKDIKAFDIIGDIKFLAKELHFYKKNGLKIIPYKVDGIKEELIIDSFKCISIK